MNENFKRPDKNEKRIKRLESAASMEKTAVISVPHGGLSANLTFYAGKLHQALKISYWINGGTIGITCGDSSFVPSASAATVCVPLEKGNNSIAIYVSSGASTGQIIFEKTDLKE